MSSNQWRASAKVEAGWEKPGYLDSAWQAAKELGDYGMAPWGAAGFAAEHRLPARMLRKEFAAREARCAAPSFTTPAWASPSCI